MSEKHDDLSYAAGYKHGREDALREAKQGHTNCGGFEEAQNQLEQWETWARRLTGSHSKSPGMQQAALEGNLRALQLATVRLLREVQPHHIPGTAYDMARQAIAAFPDVTCTDCHGSGTRMVGDHTRGPDGDTYEVECAGCQGVGTVPPSVELKPCTARGPETHTCERCGTVKPKGEPCIHFDEGARAANRGGLG